MLMRNKKISSNHIFEKNYNKNLKDQNYFDNYGNSFLLRFFLK